jgi:hypothetical protein
VGWLVTPVEEVRDLLVVDVHGPVEGDEVVEALRDVLVGDSDVLGDVIAASPEPPCADVGA